jgi:protein involved in polysaccharide export with SLBB domain
MRAFVRSLLRRISFLAALSGGAVAALTAGAALGQGGVPIPVQEQVQLFNSLPPSQQQSLIREMQRQLPPAQRDAIVNMLQGREGRQSGAGQQPTELDPQAALALQQALDKQQSEGDEGSRDEIRKPKFKPHDTAVLEFRVREVGPQGAPRPLENRPALEEFRDRLAKGNPYELDGSGALMLPGVAAINLAGLNVEQATIRILAEPALKDIDIILTRLPLEPVGAKALKPFGYDLFERQKATSFTPAVDIPVPADYVVGPGDTVNVQLFGNQNQEYFLEVSREGTISFPEIGPINVSGLSFTDVRNTINQRVMEQMIGVRASITLGELRSIRVFVLGDVEKPGSYSVSGLSTMTNALLASGGVKPIGSLRNVALRRNGVTVSTLDLYDLLLRGDTRSDARLQPGDAIFVPPVGATVAVEGEARRPAIYEIKGERSVAELIALAGGLNAEADRSSVKLERVVASRGTTVEDVDITAAAGGQTTVRDGDVLRVPPNIEQLQNSVRLDGNVYQPGLYQWFRGMRLRDLLPSPDLIKPKSDLGYVLVRRETVANVTVDVVSADLGDAWLRPNGPNNVALEARDTIYVFNVDNGRQQYIAPLMETLQTQAPSNTPVPIVRVAGQVRAPGDYPLERGMRISDLLRAGGGLSEAAYGNTAELTRYAVVNGEYRETALVTVDLVAVLKGDAAANLPLNPYDALNVKEVSRWRGEESITIRGQVTFPGTYPIRRGETLSSVLMRAGGLTDLAFPEGGVFTRAELRDREKEQLEVLAKRIERDLAAISISEPNASQTITTGQSLITQLRDSVATGRLVIRLGDIARGVEEADVILKDRDLLVVPDRQQEVTVLGEVQYATSHVWERGLSRTDYIGKSGGTTQRADTKRTYVVRASGEVVSQTGGRWFRRGDSDDVGPGDTIVVPLKVDQPLSRWSAVTQIIYNLAIAAAAVQSF